MVATVEFLNELIDRFAAATLANRKTRGRKGAVVVLAPPDAADVMLAGDLHGNRVNFQKVLRAADLDRHPQRHLVLQEVIHGGPRYENGGCMSHLLLEDVAALKARYPDRVHFMLSNHELSECEGQQISKGKNPENFCFLMGLEHAYGPASLRIKQAYHEFIQTCPLGLKTKSGVWISHSLPDERMMQTFDPKVLLREPGHADFLPGGSAYSLVWGRPSDPKHVARFAKLVQATVMLNGHMPTPEGYSAPNEHQLIFDASGRECWVCCVPCGGRVTHADALSGLQKL